MSLNGVASTGFDESSTVGFVELSTDDLSAFSDLAAILRWKEMSRVTRKTVFCVSDQADTNWAVQPKIVTTGLKFLGIVLSTFYCVSLAYNCYVREIERLCMSPKSIDILGRKRFLCSMADAFFFDLC